MWNLQWVPVNINFYLFTKLSISLLRSICMGNEWTKGKYSFNRFENKIQKNSFNNKELMSNGSLLSMYIRETMKKMTDYSAGVSVVIG